MVLAALFASVLALQDPPPPDIGEVEAYTQFWIDGKRSKQLHRKLPVLGKGLNIHALALSSDGATIAGADADGSITTWDAASGRRSGTLRGGAKFPMRLEFVDQDRALLASTWEGPVTRWGLKSGRAEQEFDGFTRFAPAPDRSSATLWSATDARLHTVDPATARLLRERTSTADAVRAMELSPDGRFLAVAGYPPNCIAMIDLETGKTLYRKETGQASMFGHVLLKFSPDGAVLIWSLRDRFVHFSDAASGHELAQYKNSSLMIQQIDFSPDGRIFAFARVGDSDFTVMDWRTLGLVATFLPASGSGTSTVLFSRDGKRLYGGANEWGVMLLDLQGAEKVQASVLRADDSISSLWQDLSRDVGSGVRACHALGEIGDPAVRSLAKQLAALPPVDEAALPRLIADLDADRPETRSEAARDLLRLGEAAKGPLKKELEKDPSAEVRGAILAILQELAVPAMPPERAHLRRHRALYAIELAGSPAALQALKDLSAAGDDCLRAHAAAAAARLGRK